MSIKKSNRMDNWKHYCDECEKDLNKEEHISEERIHSEEKFEDYCEEHEPQKEDKGSDREGYPDNHFTEDDIPF